MDDASTSAAAEVVRTVETSAETVRTTPAPYEQADKRFEVRLPASQLARWRTIATQQGVSLADLVRFAVEHAAQLPAGHAREHLAAEGRARLEAVLKATLDEFRKLRRAGACTDTTPGAEAQRTYVNRDAETGGTQ